MGAGKLGAFGARMESAALTCKGERVGKETTASGPERSGRSECVALWDATAS